MIETLSQPWPWWVAGPLIGLIVPLLLLIGSKQFGLSTSFRQICAATAPGQIEYFRYDWKRGMWRLALILGIIGGAAIGATWLASPDPVIGISEATNSDLAALGITDFRGMVPSEFISWGGLLTLPGFVMVVVGGFFVGFGARYADGCTSGHAISGLSTFQFSSLIAVLGFFAGGLVATHLLLPLVFRAG
jgi:uncharacterized membrane protein YedE/YeeE